MERKLLVICGPTATGKTSLALHLASSIGRPAFGRKTEPIGELVSADSRQVYKGMDIGTGKDLPINVKCQMSNVKCFGKRICFYVVDGTKIWGYDLVEPTEEFSVAQYVKIGRYIIEEIWRRRKLPILVGGTGLYIKGLVDGIPTVKIPKNESLRKSLEGKVVSELFEILAQVDPLKSGSMNTSDRRNPRRLIRAIELVSFDKYRKKAASMNQFIEVDDVLFIGLTAPKKNLDEIIEERVEKRIKQGIEKEIEGLFKKGVTWGNQSMQALGYKQWQGFFENKKTLSDVVLNWKRAEKQYAKRQLTWFKRDKRIKWFDISKRSWENSVEKLSEKWHNDAHAQKN